MIIVPIFIPTSSGGDGPLILGTKNVAERGILAMTLFLSGLITSGIVFYVTSVLDNVGSRYFRDEPSRLLSAVLPQGDYLPVLLFSLAPMFVGLIIGLVVAGSEKAFARILGWVTVVAMLSIIVMGFIPV